MGKATKKKQRAEEERIAKYEAILHPTRNKEYSEQSNLKRIKALQEKTDRHDIIHEFYEVFPKQIFGKYYLHKPSTWVSSKKTENFHVQLADLTDYVLCKYPVPRVLVEAVVRSPMSRYRTWFSYASRGWSLFDAKKDFPMTRKECHHFLGGVYSCVSWTTPTMSYAIACAKAYALGWPKDQDLKLSYIAHLFRDDDFVLVHEEILDFMRFVLKWINDFSENDYQQVWDFVKNTGTSLQGRSPRTAVELAANWHYEQQFKRIGMDKEWEGYPIDNWVSNDAGNVWCIKQLTSSRQLWVEGQAMHHCVNSYANGAERGRCAIFSATKNGTRTATVELRPCTDAYAFMIVQKRGPCNADPDKETENVLAVWCKKNSIKK